MGQPEEEVSPEGQPEEAEAASGGEERPEAEAEAGAEAGAAAHLDELPEPLLLRVLAELPAAQLVQACRLVCLRWRELVDGGPLWLLKCQQEGLVPEGGAEGERDHWQQFYFLSKRRRNLLRNPCGEGEGRAPGPLCTAAQQACPPPPPTAKPGEGAAPRPAERPQQTRPRCCPLAACALGPPSRVLPPWASWGDKGPVADAPRRVRDSGGRTGVPRTCAPPPCPPRCRSKSSPSAAPAGRG